MKNIFKIFFLDAKRIGTNVVALVVIMGLSVLPSLYGWFNILSNWDPYGPEATGRMQIAVCSEDKGQTIEGVEINIGDSVVDGLKQNTTMGWVFLDSSEDALYGVNSGEYYAALVIPEDFTADMLGFLSDSVTHGQIEYYENEKKNAIAPKITSKAQQAVKEQVNETFVSTLTETMVEASSVLGGEEGTGVSLLDTVLSHMNALDSDLSTYITMLDSFINIINSASSLLTTTQTMLPNLGTVVQNGQSTVNTLQSALIAADGSVQAASRLLSVSLDTVDQSLASLASSISAQILMIQSGMQAPEAIAQLATVVSSLESVMAAHKSTVEALGTDAGNAYQKVLSDLTAISADINALSQTTGKTEQDINALTAKIQAEIESCRNAVKALRDSYTFQVQPQIDQTVNDLQISMVGASEVLNSIDSNFSDVAVVLQQYKDTMENGNGNLQDSREMAVAMKNTLESYMQHIIALSTDEQYEEIMEMLKNDPALIGRFVSSPVAIDTVTVYEIDNYGSAMAPFYTILAIWVGALILVALIHVKVKKDPSIPNMKHYQTFFGRYLTFYLIGQIQTLLTVLGNFFFIGIQCKDYFLFWFACSYSSFVFTLLMYSLTVAFGNVGEAIAVVIMVLQVAGAGGTFPIEVLPDVYQKLYIYLPFTYGLKAMKECIGGRYGNDYWIAIGYLSIFAAISLFIGLVVAIPCKKLNKKIEISKERTGIMM